jgi:group II intron reverse transcriptase/maturase
MRNEYFKTRQVLEFIRRKSQTNKNQKFKDLYSLLEREDFILEAISRLRTNLGSDTPGIDKKSLDNIDKKFIVNLINRIKSKKFYFSPVKRVFIPKPGKSTLRPLGIPNFEDRIIQEMIRNILEAIYEPIFEETDENSNYGFRPGKGTHDAIKKLFQKGQGLEWAIEGDIEKAYDTVNHKILIQILKRKISDNHFLNLIYQGLKSGVINKGNFEHTLLGTPQGGIASPILFNIYMREFDTYIKTDIDKFIEEKNLLESRKKTMTKQYKEITKIEYKFKINLNKLRLKNYRLWDSNEKTQYKEFLKKLKQAKSKRLLTPFVDKKKNKLRYVYTRYADDWVFVSNLNKKDTEIICKKIKDFLLEKLELKLSEEKTKITNIGTDIIKFLGFRLGYGIKSREVTYIRNITNIKDPLNKKKTIGTIIRNTTKTPYRKRTTGTKFIIGLDRERILARLEAKGFINIKKKQGIRKKPWQILAPYEIINRYNYMIRGLVLYYAPMIRDFSELNYFIYLLNYSCLHTLAAKYNTSLKNIFKKFGKPLNIKVDTGKSKRNFILLDYQGAKEDYKKIKSEERPEKDIDFLRTRINWRTAYKLNRYCVICGSTNSIQIHHLRHVRKGNISGFSKVMSNLNRKTIMCCETCHRKIHRGEYNDIKLSDLYDPRIIIL